MAAIILLALFLCAVEVFLRAQRLKQNTSNPALGAALEVTAPSQTTYIDVLPLQDLTFTTAAGETKSCRTNELGIRGESFVVPKPKGVFRILCLGSDDTFGIGVDQHHTSCQRLQELLQPMTSLTVEVVNAGCPKAGPLVNFLRFRQHLIGLQPDLVVLNLKAEDLHLDQKMRGTVRLDENQNPAYASHPRFNAKGSELVDQACHEFILAEWTVDHMGGLIGLNAPRSERALVSAMELQQSHFQPIFLTYQMATSLSGEATLTGGLLISISPSPWSLQPNREIGGAMNGSSLEQDLTNALKQAQLSQVIPVHNCSEVFQRSPALKFLFSSHSGLLSAQGHDLYARSLAQFLMQRVPSIWDAPETTTQSPASLPANQYSSGTPAGPATMYLPAIGRPPAAGSQLRPLPQADLIRRERL